MVLLHTQFNDELNVFADDIETLLASLTTGVVRVDAAGVVLFLNPAAAELAGRPSREARNLDLDVVYRLVDEETRLPLGDRLPALRQSGDEGTAQGILLRPDGGELAVRDRLVPIRRANGKLAGAWLIFEDVTEIRALKTEQRWLALHDPVTGLPNRRGFEHYIERAIAGAREEGRRHGLGFLDLDDFEVITETFGQVAGDELVRQLAQIVGVALGEGGTVARVAADRFGLLAEDCPPEGLERRARKIRQQIADFRFTWQQERFEIGASLGMVPIDGRSADLPEILGAADAASYIARDDTLQVHRFNAENSQDISLAEHYGEMRWLSRIHRALKKGWLTLYRQAIVPVSGQAADGVPFYEVLIRMVDERGKIILPGSFIPAAEHFHLISTLDRWVVRTALDQLVADRERGADAAITINLSGQSLSEARFLDFVLAELDARPLPLARIGFEITETAAVVNLKRARRCIAVLRERGCRFILDDFGSGLSSFAYLKDLPVDFLKIDGTFVRNMVRDPVQRGIVRAIHEVGNVMGLSTIGEFVENGETMAALRELGVHYAQGYHIERPQPWSPHQG